MAWTQTDIDTLKTAIATGALTVRYSDGTSTTYRTLEEMREIQAIMEKEVSEDAGTRKRRVTKIHSAKYRSL